MHSHVHEILRCLGLAFLQIACYRKHRRESAAWSRTEGNECGGDEDPGDEVGKKKGKGPRIYRLVMFYSHLPLKISKRAVINMKRFQNEH